jgi:hypothetical protein
MSKVRNPKKRKTEVAAMPTCRICGITASEASANGVAWSKPDLCHNCWEKGGHRD